MIQTILVPFDFSPSSKRALAYALDLVDRTGAHLTLRHVHEIPLGPMVGGEPSPSPDEQRIVEAFEEQCREELTDEVVLPGDDRLSFSATRSGEVAPNLVGFAEEKEVDLIVMGTHGRRGVQRVFFGSTAEEVLRTAPCPVLTTRAEDENGSLSAPPSIERLVVPIDFSEMSQAAFRYAVRLSAAYEAPLTLVHVVNLPALPAAYEIDFAEADTRQLEENAKENLQQWGRSVELGDQSPSYVVEAGTPASTILSVASAPEDLLVMATRGLSGLKRTMLGSVAEDVLRRANGPVLAGRVFPDGE